MNGDFLDALRQIEKEKDIPMATLIETIESAIASAYKKAFSEAAEIRLRPDTREASASSARSRSWRPSRTRTGR